MLAGMMQYDAVKAQYQFKIEVQIIQDTAAWTETSGMWEICRSIVLVKPRKLYLHLQENYKFKILSAEASYIHSSQIMRNSYLIDMANVKIWM